ncbi:hypothetical protein BU204_01910 [Actinophytocola xanthii]|uniref:Hydrolase n=1 Tax=Actinophytocola xanthii TaxID=1912961 RepID=A0A1Q8CXR5_9PSEU|nr:hypothetical protein BU204_01910 [Actinophytocola xanthii]
MRVALVFLLAAVGLVPAAPAVADGQPSLPAPSGRHAVGTVSVHLVDRSRPDPWVASMPHRELMVSVWYPALPSADRPRARYMSPGAAERFDAVRAPGLGIPSGTVDWAGMRTHARDGAPVDRRGGRRPVVLYSPGAGDPRTWGTVLVEELASRGYVVVTIDHTYDSPAVSFPDGSVTGNEPLLRAFAQAEEEGTIPALLEKLLRVRVADARFVIDRLGTLPGGLADVVDPRRVGMFGQSAGGITAAQGMYEDRRIRAGIDLDGTLEYSRVPDGTTLMPVARHGLRQPLLLMGREGSDHTTEPSWGAFWANTHGWKRDLTLRGSRHQSYTDLVALLPQVGVGQEVIESTIGTVDPARAVAALRAYVTSFFDRWLRGRDNHLLDGPSAHYPEVAFVPRPPVQDFSEPSAARIRVPITKCSARGGQMVAEPGGFALDGTSGRDLISALEAQLDRVEDWSARVAELARPLPLGANPVGEAMSARFSGWAGESFAAALAGYRVALQGARDAVRDSLELYSSVDQERAGAFR